MGRTLIAVYESAYVAKKAYSKLLHLGCAREHIGFSKDRIQEKKLHLVKAKSVHSEIAVNELQAGCAVGVGIGVSVGIATGLLAGLGKMNLPFHPPAGYGNLSPFFEIAALIVIGLVTGSILGSLLGGLVGLGIPENEIEQYARTVRRSSVTLLALADWNAVDEMIAVLEEYNPLEIQQKSIEWKKTRGKEKKPGEPEPNGNVRKRDQS